MNEDLKALIKHKKKISSYESDIEKTLDKITEALLSSEKAEENFGYFCEYQMMEKIIKLTEFHVKNINIIIIKNFGLLIPSLQDKKILFYFFSNDYMNQLILNISLSIEERDIDFLSYYINFLKTIANKLDKSTLSLFFHKENNNFPLLDEASVFFKFQDVMIKNTARNIFLSLIKLNYEPMIQYICDIPRISDLLLLADNIKSYIIYITNININNKNINDIELRVKEVEESLVDDILFMQDILSIGIEKINYILINCFFSIPLQYLFNCIITHNKVNIVFYILNLILKNIKNEAINNLISFVLYSSQIHIKINENIANQESPEIYNLLYYNKFLTHNSSFFNLIFEEYIILVFNQNFLKSIRFIKEEDRTFQEMKEIANYIKGTSVDKNNDVNIGIKVISQMLKQGNKLQNIIKKMEKYHNLISRYTGINLGVSHDGANFSFLKIIYDNLSIYYNNNLKNNIFIQENIIKKECLYFIDCKNPFENQCLYLNQLFLILQIINSNKISSELKKFLCLNNYIINAKDEEEKNNLKNSNNNIININNNYIKDENKIISRNIKSEGSDYNKSSISEKNRNNLIKDFFGISDNKTDYIKLNMNYNLYDEYNSSIILIPKPINNDTENIPGFNNTKNIILNNTQMNFSDFNFNINNLNKLFYLYNSKKTNEENINIKSHDDLLQKIINIIFNNDRLLSIINYRLSLELIENLILGSNNHIFYEDKYNHIFYKKYIKILNAINTILLKSNSTKTRIYKNAYQYFEESFILNKKGFQNILNDFFINESFYLLFNINKNKNQENNFLNNIQNKKFSIIDFPTKEYESLQCLFQLLTSLYDLKILLKFEDNKNNIMNIDVNNKGQKILLRNIEFPLQLIDSNLNIGKTINSKELKVDPVSIIYKTNDIEYPNYFIFTYLNYLFIVSQSNKNGENNNSFLIKDRIPLRQIVAYADRGEPRALYLLKEENESEITLFFDGVLRASSMKENINNAIKVANVKEFSGVKTCINNLKSI